jgi:hypothetical protein
MSETATLPAAAPAKTRKPRDPNAPAKSFVRSVTSGKDSLTFRADIRKNGSIKSHVIHRTTDGKTVTTKRGATVEYPNLDAAKAAFDEGIKAALAKGWSEPKLGGGGYVAKPDAFTLSSLPAPKNKK